MHIDLKEHIKVKYCKSVPTKEFADVTLACRGDQFHAHKTILTSNSIKFQYELCKVSLSVQLKMLNQVLR